MSKLIVIFYSFSWLVVNIAVCFICQFGYKMPNHASFGVLGAGVPAGHVPKRNHERRSRKERVQYYTKV